MKTTTNTIIFTLAALSLGACAIDQADDAAADEDYTNEGRLSANGLSPTSLYSSGVLPSGVLTTALVAPVTTSGSMMTSVYLVECALSSDQSLFVQTRPPYAVGNTIVGKFGLAPSWLTTPLTTQQQENVSACVLSRVNESSQTVTISVRGEDSGFVTDSTEVSTFWKQEGAYFGNLFIASYPHGSCAGTEAAIATATRVCQLSGHCGMTWAGTCASACTIDANGIATSCSVGGTTFDNPATVYDQ